MSATTTIQALSLEGNHSTPTEPQLMAQKQETRDQLCATGGYPYPGIPRFDDPYKKRQWQLEHMAAAFRVFARKGFTEGTAGHISVRDPVEPNTFWINPLVYIWMKQV